MATLLILDDLLKAIAANPGNRDGKPRPCDVFDMIGGIGVGGWLALLLGRFHFDIATCIQVYAEIVRSVVPKSTKEKCHLRWHNVSTAMPIQPFPLFPHPVDHVDLGTRTRIDFHHRPATIV